MIIKVEIKNIEGKQEIELDVVEKNEREMGPEQRWTGEAYDENSNPVEINIWEYPLGTFEIHEIDSKILTSKINIIGQLKDQWK